MKETTSPVKPIPERQTVLVTGFGPFPGVSENATAQLAPLLARSTRERHASIEVHHVVLPTRWGAAQRQLSELAERHRFVAILHFGVARSARGFRIETQAHNRCRMLPDADGYRPTSMVLDVGGPQSYAATIPTRLVLERLRSAGHRASLSSDAGGFLCNAVFYHSLAEAAKSQTSPLIGFIHVPADLSTPQFTFDTAYRGSQIILETLISVMGDRR